MRRMELVQAMNIVYICMNDILQLLIIKFVAVDAETRPDIRFYDGLKIIRNLYFMFGNYCFMNLFLKCMSVNYKNTH